MFNTVNYSILLDKLNFYGIRGKSLEWFTSYVTDRQQCVSYNETTSCYKTISCGVPQGSILDPLLFLLYINDIGNCCNLLQFTLFADDTDAHFVMTILIS